MNDQQKHEQYSGVRDQEIRASLNQHWAHGALNGSNGWTDDLKAREFANYIAICAIRYKGIGNTSVQLRGPFCSGLIDP